MNSTASPGRATYGLTRTAAGLEPHPLEGAICKLAFELFVAQRRKKVVARILNERGLRTRSGAHFSDTAVGRLLVDADLKSAGVVSETLWNDVQEFLHRASAEGATRPTSHLLSGIVRCACGARMYPKPPSTKYLCGACRRKMPADDLEAIVAHALASIGLPALSVAAFQALSFSQKREIIEAAVNEIVVGDVVDVALAV